MKPKEKTSFVSFPAVITEYPDIEKKQLKTRHSCSNYTQEESMDSSAVEDTGHLALK